MNSKKKWLAVVLVLMVIVLPITVKKLRGEKGTEVKLGTVSQQEIRPTILASGTLAYRTEVNLTSELIAKVKSIAVKEGDAVTRGQVLLTLDPETYLNAIEREEASRRQSVISIERQRVALTLREKQFERSNKLIAARMIDQSRFDEDRNQLELARVELKSSAEALRGAEAVLKEAREQMAKTDILAPMDGTVVALPIKVGETAIPSTMALAGAQLMKIADTSAIQAELKVDEADIASIVIGQQADVFAAAYPERAIKGRVEKIALAPTIEAQGRAYLVTVLLDAPADMQLRSGMSARTDIFLNDGNKLLAVPVEAVVSKTGEEDKVDKHVWLLRDGRAHKAVIETGISDDNWDEVTKGLKSGDRVVTGPAKTLRFLKVGEALTELSEKDAKSKADSSDEDEDEDDSE
ncbi:MAG: efflux RND transporter periplasmic adaptor subunit [Pseudomonadota bacterium]|nr:efflux RND transporter periplasmic adaptor subunit [Pseudomonadota bacterium]